MRVLTIAGSDPAGQAGIQADLAVLLELGVQPATVVTAITAQNTRGVSAVQSVRAGMVARQIDAVLADRTGTGHSTRAERVDAMKTGMLATRAIVETVAAKIVEHKLPNLVVDPVLRAHTGRRLLATDAVPVLKERLLPLATVITPNIPEAETLLGHRIEDMDAARDAVREFRALGCRWALLKTSHLAKLVGARIVDLLSDGRRVVDLPARRLPVSVHGTGCVLSAAIAAGLAQKHSVPEAVATAHWYVARRLRRLSQEGSS